jgi:hypothetical protein
MGMSDAAAKQAMKPSEAGRFIGSLLVSSIIQPHFHGWIVVDEGVSGAMSILR